MTYVVDLDDTLINSTVLNNDAYNYALEQYGYKRIFTTDRLTRKNLGNINCNLKKIIMLKQVYFTKKWLAYRVIFNKILISKIRSNQRSNCFLWTKADCYRAFKTLQLCNLSKYFNNIIFDDKKDITASINKLKTIIGKSEFIIYENDYKALSEKHYKVVDSISNNYFDVRAYLVS